MRKLLIVGVLSLGLAAPAFSEDINVGVNGMVCAFCIKGIETAFLGQPTVDKVNVDLDKKLVAITTKSGATLEDATIQTLITNAGFTPTSICHAAAHRAPGAQAC